MRIYHGRLMNDKTLEREVAEQFGTSESTIREVKKKLVDFDLIKQYGWQMWEIIIPYVGEKYKEINEKGLP